MLAAITWALERADRETYGPHIKTDVHVTQTDDVTAAKVAAVQRRRWRQCGGGDGDVVTVFLSQGKILR